MAENREHSTLMDYSEDVTYLIHMCTASEFPL